MKTRNLTLAIALVCVAGSVNSAQAQKTYWMGRIEDKVYVFDTQLPQSFGDAIAAANTGAFVVNRNPEGFDTLNASGTSYSVMQTSITSNWEMFENRLPKRSVSMVAKGGGGGANGSWIAMQNTDKLVQQFANKLPQRVKGKWFKSDMTILVSPNATPPNLRLPVPPLVLAKHQMIQLSEHTLAGFFYPQVQRPLHIVPFRQAMLDYGNAGRRDPDFRKKNGAESATDLTKDTTYVKKTGKMESVIHDNSTAPYFLDHVVNQQLTEAAQYQAEYQASIDRMTHAGPASYKGDKRVNDFNTRVGYFNGPGKSFEACGWGGMGNFPHQWMVGETHFRPWFNVNGGIYQVGYGAAKSKSGKWYYTAVISGVKPSETGTPTPQVAANNSTGGATPGNPAPGSPGGTTPPAATVASNSGTPGSKPRMQPRPRTNTGGVALPDTSKRGPQFETGKPLSSESLDAAIAELTDPQKGGYTLVYDADLSKLGTDFAYTADNSQSVGSFDKVAYLLELDSTPAHGGSVFENYTKKVLVSMKAFTTEVVKVSFPLHGEILRRNVESMNVYSNVAALNGKGTGSIEFWSNDYVPGDDNSYNNNDQTTGRDFGYGSMQVFNPRGETVFAINGWDNGPKADIGIGNSSVTKEGKTHTDWTFANNADTYRAKRLRIYVHKTQ